MKTYYFDHSASTPIDDTVLSTVAEVMKACYANASALHRSGAEALKLVDRARASVAAVLGSSPAEVVFTSGGTESNNLAIKGVLGSVTRANKHIVSVKTEHASVYETIRKLEQKGEAEVTWVKVDESGLVDPASVEEAVCDDTVLVSIMQVNNETGTVQPIAEIGERLQKYGGVRFHVDGVQAIGRIPVVEWSRGNVDLYTGSAHKFRGPKGVGLILVRDKVSLAPLHDGGSQEDGRRGGTYNVPLIVGLAQALRLAAERMEVRVHDQYELRDRLLAIVETIPELVPNGFGKGERNRVAPHIVNFSYPGMRPEVLVHMLEKNGILVSTQSACSSKSLKPSRVLLQMGHDASRASGAIRISFGEEHTERDIDIVGERLREVVRKLKPLEGKGT